MQQVPIALFFHILFGDKPQRGAVDAVAHAAFVFGTIVKQMPQMRVSSRAAHLCAEHAKAPVGVLLQPRARDGLGEARPARARIELVFGRKQRLACGDVDIDSFFVVIPILVCRKKEKSFPRWNCRH